MTQPDPHHMPDTRNSSQAPFDAAAVLRQHLPDFRPQFAMVLGSGLGDLADQIADAVTIPYRDLPGFPVSTVPGHAGDLVCGTLGGVPVVCMKGRSHFYEGKGMDVMASAIRTFKLMGCASIILTCAAGSLCADAGPGSLVVLTDHINLLPGNPLTGSNDTRFGPRFVSMANAYDTDLRQTLRQSADALGIAWHEGVYLAISGPSFETPAEIRMMRTLGADLVGMSTVPEVIAARHCGLTVLAIATVTNLAEGLSDMPLSHEQTLQYAAVGAKDLMRLLPDCLQRLALEPDLQRVQLDGAQAHHHRPHARDHLACGHPGRRPAAATPPPAPLGRPTRLHGTSCLNHKP
jgi:xanthosine phosphorylase